jgi:hypothetical protein
MDVVFLLYGVGSRVAGRLDLLETTTETFKVKDNGEDGKVICSYKPCTIQTSTIPPLPIAGSPANTPTLPIQPIHPTQIFTNINPVAGKLILPIELHTNFGQEYNCQPRGLSDAGGLTLGMTLSGRHLLTSDMHSRSRDDVQPAASAGPAEREGWMEDSGQCVSCCVGGGWVLWRVEVLTLGRVSWRTGLG